MSACCPGYSVLERDILWVDHVGRGRGRTTQVVSRQVMSGRVNMRSLKAIANGSIGSTQSNYL